MTIYGKPKYFLICNWKTLHLEICLQILDLFNGERVLGVLAQLFIGLRCNTFFLKLYNLCIVCDQSFSFFQYIFGDFSPDEFNQFFVTPRSSVEVRHNFALLSTCIDLIDGYVLVLVF